MTIQIKNLCPVCQAEKAPFAEGESQPGVCETCGEGFDAFNACPNGHQVCLMCTQKHARQAIITHCFQSSLDQPYPLLEELFQLPEVGMHGPEHHLLLTAALLTAYANEKSLQDHLPTWLVEANQRSLGVPGAACGFWGICGAAIGSGIYMSILKESSSYATKAWEETGQVVYQGRPPDFPRRRPSLL